MAKGADICQRLANWMMIDVGAGASTGLGGRDDKELNRVNDRVGVIAGGEGITE